MSSKNVILFVFGALLMLSFVKSFRTEPFKFETIEYFPEMPISKDNPVTIEGVYLGRFLFYDSILSVDFSFSCASCHKQKFAFSDNHKFSSGVKGDTMERNTMPLYNLAWYPSFFWDGRASSIEDQVFFPVREHDEMGLNWNEAENRIRNSNFYRPLFKQAFGNQKIDSILIAKAIAQFERVLISNNSKFDRVLHGKDFLSADEYKGYELVNDQVKGGCLHCHITDGNGLGTNLEFSNNGLDSLPKDLGYYQTDKKEENKGKFRVPSLRNLGFTAPYMHDGRFNTLMEVLDFYGEDVKQSKFVDSKMTFAHQGGNKLTNEEKLKIIAFLNTLNDSIFIKSEFFANPFGK